MSSTLCPGLELISFFFCFTSNLFPRFKPIPPRAGLFLFGVSCFFRLNGDFRYFFLSKTVHFHLCVSLF